MLRQPVYDKNRNLVDYQWDSCEVEFTSKLGHPVVAGAELISVVEEKVPDVRTTTPQVILAKPISELNLSVRAVNCLVNANIKTVGELATRHPVEVKRLKGVGNTMLDEYAAALGELGIPWGRWQG
jgi:DNA-directed RNA polymerase alpha subunit